MNDRAVERHNAQAAPCIVSHVADFYQRYPGEDVTLFTRVQVREPLSGFSLRITLPQGLESGVTRAPDDAMPGLAVDEGARYLVWTVEGELQAGSCYEYQVQATVAATPTNRVLRSRAVVSADHSNLEQQDGGPGALFLDEDTVTLAVSAKGRYLDYLPALYDTDELMGRFLMLFESFWAPIQGQIDQLPLYFDPKMAPPDLLPWLASWLDLALDERWPEERRRQLLRSAAALFRKRGTRRGLQEYLEIFTGERVEIIEHRANNLVLGPAARLGPGIALGTDNVPHTFTVIVQPPANLGDDETAPEVVERRRIIKNIIEAEKPGHTAYTLRFEDERTAHGPTHRIDQAIDQTEG